MVLKVINLRLDLEIAITEIIDVSFDYKSES